MMAQNKYAKITKDFLYHFFVCFFGLIMLYPLLWMVSSSFKPNADIFSTVSNLIPQRVTTENYVNGMKGFAGIQFFTYFQNSFIVSTLATIGAVISSTIVAYGFARLNFKGRGFWFSCMLITMMLPFQVIMIPQYIIFRQFRWVGTFLPLIVPNFFGGAFFIFLIVQFMYGIPKDLSEAATIDGCSTYGIFLRIITPLVTPAMATTAIFSFMWKWDDFLAPLIYLNKPARYTASVALRLFSDPSSNSDWGAMFAMATLSLLPIFVIFVFFQKYLVEGISTQGLKG